MHQHREAARDALGVPERERVVEQQRRRLEAFGEHPRRRQPDDQRDLIARTGGEPVEVFDVPVSGMRTRIASVAGSRWISP